MQTSEDWEAIVIGAGLAGLSAAIYLGRALRRTLVIDDQRSLALWEPDVQNYLGFPEGVPGEELLRRGEVQAKRYGVHFAVDTIQSARREDGRFVISSKERTYRGSRLLLATGLFHLPPDVPGVKECLGQSMFFCKDCDAYRVQGKRIAILGRNNEAVEYALAMLLFSPCVIVATNGKSPGWDEQHATWLKEYDIPVFPQEIVAVEHSARQVLSVVFKDHGRFAVDSVFTTRGDVYHNQIAEHLGARLDEEGQIVVNARKETTVKGFYAAGCVTPANCQMIIAAGEGAAAAQAINRDLFEESLANHALRHFRTDQLQTERTVPESLHQVVPNSMEPARSPES
ncbi:MAG: NAD(P)/FAD-dependent oxidoreductase [Verrucomicrobiia bacterium]